MKEEGFKINKYVLYADPEDDTRLVGINQGLEIPYSLKFMVGGGNFVAKEVGMLKNFSTNGEGGNYPFSFNFGNLDEDRIRLLSDSIFESLAKKHWDQLDFGIPEADYYIRMGYYKGSDLYRTLIRLTMVEGNINLLTQKSDSLIDGSCISNHHCSRWYIKKLPTLDYRCQFFANIGDAVIKGVRDSPGSSGWDVDGIGAKYHRANDMTNDRVGFKNKVGNFHSSVGLLQKIKSIKLLSMLEIQRASDR